MRILEFQESWQAGRESAKGGMGWDGGGGGFLVPTIAICSRRLAS